MFSPMLKITLIYLCCCLGLVFSQQTPSPKEIHSNLFRVKRAEHLDAVKTILNLSQTKKQQQLVTSLVSTISKVLSNSKVSVEKNGFIPGSPFPEDRETQELVSTILENASFFADLALRLPDQIHPIYKHSKELQFVIPWSIHFCIYSGLVDEVTLKAINLAQQELGLIERDPDYTNPYKSKTLRELNHMQHNAKKPEVKKQKEKKKKKKGPGLSGTSEL